MSPLTSNLHLFSSLIILTTLYVSISGQYRWPGAMPYNPWMMMNPMMAASFGSYSMVPPPMGYMPPRPSSSSRVSRRMGGGGGGGGMMPPMPMPMPFGPMMPPMMPMMPYPMMPGMMPPVPPQRRRRMVRKPVSTRELTGYKMDGAGGDGSNNDEAFADQIVSASMRISNGGSPVIRYRGPRGSKFTIGKPWEFFT